MTRQNFPITKLKWPAWLALLLIFAACATSAPPGNLTSVQRDSQPPRLPRQAAEVAEASSPIGEPPAQTDFTTPVSMPETAAFTPSPQIPPIEINSGPPNLDNHVPIDEAAPEAVVSNAAPVFPTEPPFASTPAIVVTPPPATPVAVAVDLPIAPLLTETPAPLPTAVLQRDTEDKLREENSVAEASPIPTAVAIAVEPALTPLPDPAQASVTEPIAVVDAPEDSASAHRFVLPSAQGKQVSLDDYLVRGNVVLIFYRAFW